MSRPRLLVLRALGLGDLLTGLPALRALRRAFPDHESVLLVPDWLRELAEAARSVDTIQPHEGLAPVPEHLHGCEIAVDLHGRGPASQAVLLEARPGRLLAFANEQLPETASGATWWPGEYEVRRWGRMLEHYGIAVDDLDLALDVEGRSELDGATIIHPGAKSRARQWPLERFAAVARHERSRGRDVLVTASNAERGLALALVEAAGLARSSALVGLPLRELAEVVAGAGRVVSGDTGIAHLATATSTSSVVLFGPVSPAEWGPPAGDSRHIALWAGAHGDPHGSTVDAGLLRIQVEQVLEALDRLAAQTGTGSGGAPTALAGPSRRF